MSSVINTTLNVWEMGSGYDIILLIDKNTIHDCRCFVDEAYRRINSKYPFEKLLFNMNAKTLLRKTSGGRVLIFSVYGETICCLFLNGRGGRRKPVNLRHESAAFHVEMGLRTIRDRLSGYRYLAVQRVQFLCDLEVIFRMVFERDSGELWMCGNAIRMPTELAENGLRAGEKITRESISGNKKKEWKNKAIVYNQQISSNLITLNLPDDYKSSEQSSDETEPIELWQPEDVEMFMRMTQSNTPVIKITRQNAWELNTEVNIILFIELEMLFIDDWKDEVVDHVNARYPFKDRLLADKEFMPMNSGDVISYYQQDDETTVFCVFFSRQSASFSNWLVKALLDIRRSMAGRIQFAVQDNAFVSEFQLNIKNDLCCFFQSETTFDTITLWMCGGV